MRKRHPNFIDRTGEIGFNTYGCKMTIVKYESKRDCNIQFENGYIVYNANYNYFKKGMIKNPFHPLIFEKGYMGEGNAEKHVNHKVCYAKWHDMLKRGYDPEYHKKQSTYINVTIYKEWHNYQLFAEWFHKLYDSILHSNWQLDKDLLVKGNKHYSPSTCCLLPSRLNSMLTIKKKVSGKYPTGVVKDCTKYHASIYINGKRERSKLCDTIEEASLLYNKLKEKEIYKVTERYKEGLSPIAYKKLMNYKIT